MESYKRVNKKLIGVIGGIGAVASANLYQKMINYMQEKYGAVYDSEYPPMLIYNLSMEGFDETGIRDAFSVESQLIDACKKLESTGAELLIIACNTVHCFYDSLVKNLSIPILNIIDETASVVRSDGVSKAGLICSQSTRELCLYQPRFNKVGIDIVEMSDEQQEIVNDVIEVVMAGKQGQNEIINLKDIIRDLAKQGAEAIILGCTETPLAINQVHTDIKLYDTIGIIIQAAVDMSLGQRDAMQLQQS